MKKENANYKNTTNRWSFDDKFKFSSRLVQVPGVPPKLETKDNNLPKSIYGHGLITPYAISINGVHGKINII